MILLRDLSRIYTLKNIVLFEGKLYEKLANNFYSHRYRVIISDDDYDYVTCRNLKRRLERVFKGTAK